MKALHQIAFALGFVFPGLFFGQTQKKADTVYCDCKFARTIKISGSGKIGPTIAPPGPGEVIEKAITRIKTPYAFEKEHHSAWYRLEFNTQGAFAFDLLPQDPEDDYDFMLFKAGKNDFCDSLEKNKLKPVRANISRDKTELKGKTGLSLKAKKEMVKEGVNDAYCKAIPVSKGEFYYLVVDNVYENGSGHTISFFFEQKVEIKGEVRDEANRPLITDVTLTDTKGETLSQTRTDARSGAYTLPAMLKRGTFYTINYYSDSSFVFSKTVSLKDSLELKDIKVMLPKLKKGKKYTLGAINFYGNQAEYLPRAISSIENLYKLLDRNKKLKILIEGHINCADLAFRAKGKVPKDYDPDGLSLRRADKIKVYLVKKGIDVARLETIGKGCTEMLFPSTIDDDEMEQNRRVEVKVLEF